MTDGKDNLRGVYKTLKSEGYTPPDFEQFAKDMEDIENLRGVYSTLQKEGYTPPDFDVFRNEMGFYNTRGANIAAGVDEASNRAQQQAQEQAQRNMGTPGYVPNRFGIPTQQQGGTGPVADAAPNPQVPAQPLSFQERVQKSVGMAHNVGKAKADFSQRMSAIEQGNKPFSNGKAQHTGETKDVYYTTTGQAVSTPMERDIANIDNSPQGRIGKELEDAYAERDRLEQELSSRSDEVKADGTSIVAKIGAGTLLGLTPAGVLAPELAKQIDKRIDPQWAMLNAAKRANDKRIAILERDRDRDGFFRTVGKTLFDIDTWDFGANEIADAVTLLAAADKKLTGKAGEAQEALMRNTYLKQIAEQRSEDDTFMQRAGDITANAIPFVLEFILTGGGYAAIGAAGRRFGVKAAAKIGAKGFAAWTMKNTGTLAGNMLSGLLMANTTGLGRTAADIMGRHQGVLTQDENGDYVFRDGKSWGRSVYEGEMAQAIEYFTEHLGNSVFDKALGRYVYPTAGKLLTKGLDKLGASKVSEIFSRMSNSEWAAILDKGGIQGYPSEVLEEGASIVLNSLLVGDNQFSDLWDRKTLSDILGGMALSIGFMQAPGVAHGAYNTAQYYRFKHNTDKSDQAAAKVMGEQWEDMRGLIDNTPNEGMQDVIDHILDSPLPDDYKATSVTYAYNLMKLRGYNLRTAANAKDRMADTDENGEPRAISEEETAVNEAFANGYEADEQQRSDISIEREDNPNDPQAQAAWDGVQQRIADDAEDNAEAKRETYRPMMRKDGTIHPVTLNVEGADGQPKTVYLLEGSDVVLNPDGSIDRENSSPTLTVYDPEQGKNVFLDDPYGDRGIQSVGEVLTQEDYEGQIEAERQAEVESRSNLNNMSGRIEGAPENYTPGMVIGVVDDAEQEHAAEVVGRVRYDRGKFVPDENGMFVEYTVDGQTKIEAPGKLNGMVRWHDTGSGANGQNGANGEPQTPAEQPQQSITAAEGQTPTAGTETPQEGGNDATDTRTPAQRTYDDMQAKYGEKASHKVDVTLKDRKATLDSKKKALDNAQADYDDAPIGKEDKAEAALTKAQEEYDNALADYNSWDAVRKLRDQALLAQAEQEEQQRKAERERRLAEETEAQRKQREEYEAEQARRKAEAEAAEKRRQEENARLRQQEAEAAANPQPAEPKAPIEGTKGQASQLEIARQELEGDPEALAMLDETEPRTLDEVAATLLASGKNATKLLKEDFKRETGYSDADVKRYPFLFAGADKGGITLARFGEMVVEAAREYGVQFDESDATAGIGAALELLGSVSSQADINGYITNSRIAEAYDYHNAALAAAWANMLEAYGMTEGEYEAYMSWLEDAIEQGKSTLSDEEFNQLFNVYEQGQTTDAAGGNQEGAETTERPEGAETDVSQNGERGNGETDAGRAEQPQQPAIETAQQPKEEAEGGTETAPQPVGGVPAESETPAAEQDKGTAEGETEQYISGYKPSKKVEEFEKESNRLAKQLSELEEQRDRLSEQREAKRKEIKGLRGKKREEANAEITSLGESIARLNEEIDRAEDESNSANYVYYDARDAELYAHLGKLSKEKLEALAKQLEERLGEGTDALFDNDEYSAIINVLDEKSFEEQAETPKQETTEQESTEPKEPNEVEGALKAYKESAERQKAYYNEQLAGLTALGDPRIDQLREERRAEHDKLVKKAYEAETRLREALSNYTDKEIEKMAEEAYDAGDIFASNALNDVLSYRKRTQQQQTPKEEAEVPAESETPAEQPRAAVGEGENKEPEKGGKVEKVKNEAAPKQKIDDVGEKIGGARKDLAQKMGAKINLDADTFPKMFPKFDLKKAVEQGLDPKLASSVYFLRIAAQKEYKSWLKHSTKGKALSAAKFFAAYAKQFLENGNTSIEFKDNRWTFTEYGKKHIEYNLALYEKVYAKFGNTLFDLDLTGYEIKPVEKNEWSHYYRKNEQGKEEEYQPAYEARSVYSSKYYEEGELDKAIDELVNRMAESVSYKESHPYKLSHYYTPGVANSHYVGVKLGGKVVALTEKMGDKETSKYLKDHEAELQEKAKRLDEERKQSKQGGTNTKWKPELGLGGGRARVGNDYRNGKDVSAEDFRKTFGFRGVEFGNYVTQAERQRFINEAYDAMMDLAALLNVSPRALSLGGRLGFAIGARGGGNAMAHYEPDLNVINLTKSKGAGSLAHEWWHALDYYFNRMGDRRKTPATENKRAEDFNPGHRAEMANAFVSLMEKINSSDYRKRSVALDAALSKDYYTNPTELGARAFQDYVQRRLTDRGQVNDFLSSFTPEEQWNGKAETYPYPTGKDADAIDERFDNLFGTMLEREDEQGNVVLYERVDGKAARVSAKERKVRDAVVDLLRKAGIDVVTESEEGQRVLDMANGRERQHRVYHGSGADFEAFDHSHMGEGEGAQAFGWGTYVTEVEGIGRHYAENLPKVWFRDTESGYEVDLEEVRDNWDESDVRLVPLIDVFEGLRSHNNNIYEAIENAREIARHRVKLAEEFEDWRDQKESIEAGLAFLEELSADDFEIDRNLYTVEIPEDNGSNYLEWDKPIGAELAKKLQDFAFEQIMNADYRRFYPIGEEQARADLQRVIEPESDMAWVNRALEGRNISAKAISEFLHSAGFVGVKYPAEYYSGGRADNAKNYVIFDEGDLQITDKVKFFRTENGEAYGFTMDGKIYLDPNIATAETPVHEYTHLWAAALRAANPKAWEQLKSELSKDTELMAYVQRLYPELKGDELMDEVFAHFSGRRGAERLREEQRKAMDEASDYVEKAGVVAMFERLRDALRRFWNMARDLFAGKTRGIKSRSAEDFADMVLGDLVRGFNPSTDSDVRFRGEEEPVFYSNAMRAVENIKQERATPEQWAKMIEKQGGLKAGEDKWLGLSEWLKGSDAKTLTKGEVLDYIRANEIQVEEVEYGSTMSDKAKKNLEEYNNEFLSKIEELDSNDKSGGEVAEMAFGVLVDRYGDDFENAFELTWDHGSPRLEPQRDYVGGFVGEAKYFLDMDGDEVGQINSTRLSYTTEGLDNKREIVLTVPTIEPWNEHDEVHFGEAGGGRAVAWVRFGETTDADGKRVLVIDEIQSKRHQEGREKGYFEPEARKAYKEYKEYLKKKYPNGYVLKPIDEVTLRNNRHIWSGKEEVLTEEEKAKFNELEAKAGYANDAVPDAPFEKNWHEVAMKRMLRFAAENGYDKVAWTKGEQQAERYNLSTLLDHIDVYPHADEMTGKRVSGEYTVIPVDKSGNYMIASTEHPFSGNLTADEVLQYYGKDLGTRMMQAADKAGKDEKSTIDGEGLRIGGEGMKGFYDQILPRFMDKYGKKWGVKTGEVRLDGLSGSNGENGVVMHAVDVTDDMRESVMRGQPLFRPKTQSREEAAQGDWYDRGSVERIGEFAGYTPKRIAAMNARQEESARRQFRDAAEKLHLGDRITFVDTIDEIEGIDEKQRKEWRRKKGWYSPRTGKIVIILGNHKSMDDVMKSILHEGVAHHGLRQMFGVHFDTFLDNVYLLASSEIRERINEMAKKHGWDFREATEEYLATLAEDTDFEKPENQSWWKKVKAMFIDLLHKIGFRLHDVYDTITDNELRYILWRSYENLVNPGRYNSVVEEAKDIAKQYDLKVGEWDETWTTEIPEGPNATMEYGGRRIPIWATNGRRGNREDREDREDRMGSEYNVAAEGVAEDGNTQNYKEWESERQYKKAKELLSALHDAGYKDFYISRSMTDFGVSTYIQGMFGAKFRLSDHSVTRFDRLIDEEHITHNTTPESVVATVKEYEKRAKERNKAFDDMREREKQLDEKWERIKPLFDGLVFKRNERTYQNFETFSSKGNRSNIVQIPTTKGAFKYEWTEPKEPNGLGKEKPSYEWLEAFDEEASEVNTVRFRDGDFTERDEVMARDYYERMVSSSKYQFREAMQDSMLGLRKAYEAILGGGKKFRIEEVAGNENAYLAENRMSSVNAAEQHYYFVECMKHLLEEIHKICGSDKALRQELTDYMMAKHGLERNRVFAERDAAQNPKGVVRERDYAGLTALTGLADVHDAELAAMQMVADFEERHDVSKLWAATKKATGVTLAKIYRSGLLSKESYEQIRDQFEWYIPLQGFDETTSDEVYGYLTSRQGPYGSPIKHAEGRSSKADDPIATIGMMADMAIRQANRNEMKKLFLNFVLDHPSDLVSVNRLWLQHDDVSGDWVPVFADIEEGDTAADVERKVAAFEERMEQLAAAEPDKYKHGRNAKNIPYRVLPGNLSEHQVLVKRDGETYVLTINGNPRAAQALNGLTNPDVKVGGVVGDMMKAAEWVNHNLSAAYTTRTPDFVVSNYFRDMLYSNCMTWVKEGGNYALRFHKNFGKFNPATMRVLFGKWENGTLDESKPIEFMFKQFMLNGGETGYTNVRDIEAHKREIARELKRQGNVPLKAWHAFGMQLDLLNRSVENCARFAAFITSQEMGRSVERSIYDAKEVSVNFNKKGSGGKMVNATGQTGWGKFGSYLSGSGRLLFVFWNAGTQGMTNFMRAAKHHPGKFSAGAATMFALGAIVPLLAKAIGDDDDDENAYYNLPEYVRRSNICFRFTKEMPWITIPLPIEFRAIYGLGELGTGVITGDEHYNNWELARQLTSQVSQMLPLDFMEGGGGLHAFIPSLAKPIVEASKNKSWTGLPIYRDNPFNQNDPEFTKVYKNADKNLVAASKWLNELTGGDDYKKGWADKVNPAQVEYVLNGYLGGWFKVPNQLMKMGETAFGDREFEWRNMMLANRLIKNGDERTANRKLQNEYFDLKDEYEETKRLLKKYKNAADEGVLKYAEKLAFLNESEEYGRYLIFDDYRKEIDKLYKQMKEEEGEQRKATEEEYYSVVREMVDKVHEYEKRR